MRRRSLKQQNSSFRTERHPRNTSRQAEWRRGGTYERSLGAAGYTDPVANALLKSDMQTKLPYKFSAEHVIDKSAKQWPLHGTCGIVLDIDGVVHRTYRIIDGSDVAIRHLQDLKVPLCFMTNGGGATEATKAAQLSKMLGTTISPEQVVLSHSPMRYLAQAYPHQPVLIAGRPACAAVAKQYGMQGAISVDQFQHDHPELVPFKKFTRTPAKEGSVPMPHFAAVMVFNDSEDVLNDVQVILDVLTKSEWPHRRKRLLRANRATLHCCRRPAVEHVGPPSPLRTGRLP